jgi:hypothetical protein
MIKLPIHMKQVSVRHSALDAESHKDNTIKIMRLRVKPAMTDGLQLAYWRLAV